MATEPNGGFPQAAFALPGMAQAWTEYLIDSAQRTILFWDVMRKRGNLALEHAQAGTPPVLVFDYDTVLDGRTFDRPVNYALLRIRHPAGTPADPTKRPIVVVDPRAGHGPGIGGFKQDSEIGYALRYGHPCYFVTFFPEPEPGQTLHDIGMAEARFIQTVRDLHPDSDGKPCVYGNCQAGWAVAMLSAVKPEIMGPIILAGAPLSYWAGVEGSNPMRYTGGLLGGSWLASLASDLGNGRFDGAYLVENFENLNPANTLWGKNYNLYSKVDTEEARFLEFERWWTGYFLMNKEEIRSIVDGLFVGNKLARGEIVTTDGRDTVDLRNIRSPIIIFASWGDNITPPQQALNWIADIYDSVDDIRANEQVIVYTLHESVGHLGIFVSGKVAQKQTAEFISGLDFIDILPPGLYEAVIEDKRPDLPAAELVEGRYLLRFEPRDVPDILSLDDTRDDERRFETVARVSDINAGLYETLLGPWVRAASSEATANWLRQMQPARLQRTLLSDQNPFMAPVAWMAEAVRANRQVADPDNPFVQAEHAMSERIEKALDNYRERRDRGYEALFKAIYSQPVLNAAVGLGTPDSRRQNVHLRNRALEALHQQQTAALLERTDRGGMMEAVLRMLLFLARADRMVDERSFRMMFMLRDELPPERRPTIARIKQVMKEQAAILLLDEDRAIRSLPALLPEAGERQLALDVARRIALLDEVPSAQRKARFDRLTEILTTVPQRTAEAGRDERRARAAG